MASKVTDYEVIDHGIDGAQYFQGCGVAFSKFDSVVTGCGDDFAEAIEDALESVSQDDVDTEDLEARIKADYEYGKDWPKSASATEQFEEYNEADEDGEYDYDGCDVYYYVSIRYSLPETAEVIGEVSDGSDGSESDMERRRR